MEKGNSVSHLNSFEMIRKGFNIDNLFRYFQFFCYHGNKFFRLISPSEPSLKQFTQLD